MRTSARNRPPRGAARRSTRARPGRSQGRTSTPLPAQQRHVVLHLGGVVPLSLCRGRAGPAGSRTRSRLSELRRHVAAEHDHPVAGPGPSRPPRRGRPWPHPARSREDQRSPSRGSSRLTAATTLARRSGCCRDRLLALRAGSSSSRPPRRSSGCRTGGGPGRRRAPSGRLPGIRRSSCEVPLGVLAVAVEAHQQGQPVGLRRGAAAAPRNSGRGPGPRSPDARRGTGVAAAARAVRHARRLSAWRRSGAVSSRTRSSRLTSG